MLQESDEVIAQPSSGHIVGGGGGEPQCDINGYCKGDTYLGHTALEGENQDLLNILFNN